jgi:hypothetical protein
MEGMGNESLFEGVVFVVIVTVICVIQGVRNSIERTSHSIRVKSKSSIEGV